MFTGLAEDVLKRMSSTVAHLKGKIAKTVPDCTHLVTDKVHRTVKLLSAIGMWPIGNNQYSCTMGH
jgi:hypothetical protein